MKTDNVLESYVSEHISEPEVKKIRRRTLMDIKISDTLTTLEIDKEVHEGHVVIPKESPGWTDYKEKG